MKLTYLEANETFPEKMFITEDGIVAIGGSLSTNMLLEAYSNGIFPWFNSDKDEILWWSPSPRLVLFPEELKISKSLKRVIKKKKFEVVFNKNFEAVIYNCSTIKRDGQKSTWITENMKKAYIELHKLGYAHSVESYLDGELVGGLYGIIIGKAFFGESMFANVSDASKVAFCFLIQYLKENNFKFCDCQTTTKHLISLGAKEISRDNFMRLLNEALS